ncbi:MAG: hypothetical protein QOH25_3768 [Acidobacteriota bacterium]|jgi:hypothetical protein|nr:hypothetical protein [Acidobacteriota bacterium]
MNRRRTIRLALIAAGAVATLLAWSLPALAQCAMCKNAVAGSPEAAKLSESLNFAIIILLIPPVLIFCGIFVLAFRYRKSRETELNLPSRYVRGWRGWFAKSGLRGKSKKSRNERDDGGAALTSGIR